MHEDAPEGAQVAPESCSRALVATVLQHFLRRCRKWHPNPLGLWKRSSLTKSSTWTQGASWTRSSTWTRTGSRTRSSTREVPKHDAGGRTIESAMAPCESVMAPPPCTSTWEDVTARPKPTHTAQRTNTNIVSQRGRAAEGRPPPLRGAAEGRPYV